MVAVSLAGPSEIPSRTPEAATKAPKRNQRTEGERKRSMISRLLPGGGPSRGGVGGVVKRRSHLRIILNSVSILRVERARRFDVCDDVLYQEGRVAYAWASPPAGLRVMGDLEI